MRETQTSSIDGWLFSTSVIPGRKQTSNCHDGTVTLRSRPSGLSSSLTYQPPGGVWVIAVVPRGLFEALLESTALELFNREQQNPPAMNIPARGIPQRPSFSNLQQVRKDRLPGITRRDSSNRLAPLYQGRHQKIRGVR